MAASNWLNMIRTLFPILAQIVVRHKPETKPNGEEKTESPRKSDAPKNPIRHAENDLNVSYFSVFGVAEKIRTQATPHQGSRPDRHDDQPFAAGVLQKALFF